MASLQRQITNTIRMHKEGLIIGAITGAVAANYAIGQGYDLNQIVQAGQGAIDNFLGRNAPLEDAKTKLYLGMIVVGSIIGLAMDMIIVRNFTRKRRRR